MDADVRGACESLDRSCRREVLRKRGNDGRLWRLLGKWRRAGVMAHGERTHPETGVVHGGASHPSSPLYSSIRCWRSGASAQDSPGCRDEAS